MTTETTDNTGTCPYCGETFSYSGRYSKVSWPQVIEEWGCGPCATERRRESHRDADFKVVRG